MSFCTRFITGNLKLKTSSSKFVDCNVYPSVDIRRMLASQTESYRKDDKKKFDISKLLTVLFAFPNLKQLKLQLLCRFDVQQEDAIPARHDALQHLEEVEISGFHGTPKQIEFVVLLLRCAKSLRTLIIYRTLLCLDYLLYDKPFSLSDEETRASWNNREFESISSQLSSVGRDDVTVLIQKDADLQRLM